jgi:hypothetical protein
MSELELLRYLASRIDTIDMKMDKMNQRLNNLWTRVALLSAAIGTIAATVGVNIRGLL